MADGARKKTLDFGGNSNHITLRLMRVELGLRLGGASPHCACVTWCLFVSNNVVTSAALAKVCALLSSILVNKCYMLSCKPLYVHLSA